MNENSNRVALPRRKPPKSLTVRDLTIALEVEKQRSPTAENVAESNAILKQAVAADPGYA